MIWNQLKISIYLKTNVFLYCKINQPALLKRRRKLCHFSEKRKPSLRKGRFFVVKITCSAFEYIKSELYNIDPTKSYVFAGNIPLGKEVSVYSFIRLCLEKNMVDESDSFNIEELNDYIINNLGIDVDLNLLYNSEINKPLTK